MFLFFLLEVTILAAHTPWSWCEGWCWPLRKLQLLQGPRWDTGQWPTGLTGTRTLAALCLARSEGVRRDLPPLETPWPVIIFPAYRMVQTVTKIESCRWKQKMKSHVFISVKRWAFYWIAISQKSVRGQPVEITVVGDLTLCSLVEICIYIYSFRSGMLPPSLW